MNVAERFAELLAQHGVSHVFAVPGGTALPLMTALSRRREVTIVVCKDEAGAAFMADGYAWASGKPGVVVTIGGPGATNTLTGLCCAAAQGNPIVLVSGEVATNVAGKRAAQDSTALGLDVTAITRPTTCFSFCAGSASEAVTALDAAFRRALATRRPAHVALPLDVQREAVGGDAELPAPLHEAELAAFSSGGVRRAAEILRERGQRIALLVGRGARGASAEVLALAETLGAPVATTCSGKGNFPEHHPLSVGVFSFGSGPLARAALTSGLDVLIAVGTGLGEFASLNYSPLLKPRRALIHVDDDPSVFGRSFASLPVRGDAAEVCRALVAELGGGGGGYPAWFASLRERFDRVADPRALTSEASPIRPERVMREIERALPERACLVSDIGTSCLFVAHCIRLSTTQHCYVPMAWSCMGHPVAAALGVRLGSGLPTICVAGDAAFLAKGLELHAAVERGVDRFVWVVLSNGGHALVSLGTRAILGPGHEVEAGDFAVRPDVAAIARAVGAEARRVSEPSALGPALRDALGCGRPCVVEVEVDPLAAPPMGDRIQGLSGAAPAEPAA